MVKRLVEYSPFYTDLSAATDFDEQLEVLALHLPRAQLQLTQHWDRCEIPGDPAWRYVTFVLRSGANVMIVAREMPDDPEAIQLRRVHVVQSPE